MYIQQKNLEIMGLTLVMTCQQFDKKINIHIFYLFIYYKKSCHFN